MEVSKPNPVQGEPAHGRSTRRILGVCCSLRLEPSILRVTSPFFAYPTFS